MGRYCTHDDEIGLASLPLLAKVSSKPSVVLDRILLAHMLFEMRNNGVVCRSQRDYGEIFNRVNSVRFSRSRRSLEHDGWVFRSSLSVGDRSDCYVRGNRFVGDPYLWSSWSSLAHDLWGRDGLLADWAESAGWGHGCLGVPGMLVFATVERAKCLMSRKQISDYLQTFCSSDSVKRYVKRLVDIGVFIETVDVVGLSECWSERFDGFIASSVAGAERFEKGNENRKRERLKRRQTVERGLLTDAERGQIRNLGCWFPGCSSKGKEPDHFPPKRFLSAFEDTLSPHILFAACRKHNRQSSNFIASLPDIKPEVCKEWVVSENVEPTRLFRASNNLRLVRFIRHRENNDKVEACKDIKGSLDFFYTLQEAGFTSRTRLASPVDKSRPRRRKGSALVNTKSTFNSQI